MKKYGFTLQEILISMAIIGIVAAMTLPAVMTIMPDETKTKYMKAYSALTSITNDLLSDSTIYWTEGYNAEGQPNCIGLECTSDTTEGDFTTLQQAHPEFASVFKKSSFSNHPEDEEVETIDEINYTNWQKISDVKYAIFLASRLNLQQNLGCKSNGDGGHDCTFVTTDGTEWLISTDNIGGKHNGYKVSIDVVPNDEYKTWETRDTIDFAENPNDVDTFTFEVSNEGSIRATDALGKTFLKTPSDMHRKSKDREEAKKSVKTTDED